MALLGVVDELEEHTAWHPGFEGLRESRFYGFHGVLSVLLSIQLGRPISYRSRLTVFQVIEAGLRTGSRVGLHAYAVLHIWAYKTYQPAMPAKQRQWLIEYAHKIKLSIDKGESVYRRDTSFDEAIEVLLPELGEHLSSSFGTDLMGDEGSGKDRSKT